MGDVRVVVVGDEKCGKSSLIHRFISNQVPEYYKPTGFDKFFTSKKYSDENVEILFNFTVWDTSGSTNFDSVRPLSYSEADVFLVCFSISEPISLYNVKSHWFQEIRKHSNAPIVLCGCMADLRQDQPTIQHLAKMGRSPVSVEQALTVSKQMEAAGYVETRSLQSYQETMEAFKLAAVASLEVSPPAPSLPLRERPPSAASQESRRCASEIDFKSRVAHSGSFSSIPGSEPHAPLLPFSGQPILEHDILPGHRSPLLGRYSPSLPSASLPTSPLSLPTSPAKPSPLPHYREEREGQQHSHPRSVSQPVGPLKPSLLARPQRRAEDDSRLREVEVPPLLPSQRAPSPPPRPSKALSSRSCSSSLLVTSQHPPTKQPQHHHQLNRKNSLRSSLGAVEMGKPPLPSHSHPPLTKSPTDLAASLATARQTPITVEPLLSSSPSANPLHSSARTRNVIHIASSQVQAEVTGKNYESLKSHTSTASHGSTGSKLSTASSSQISTGGYNGPRDLDLPDTSDPALLSNLEFVSPKAGVYRPVGGQGRQGKKDKCSLM